MDARVKPAHDLPDRPQPCASAWSIRRLRPPISWAFLGCDRSPPQFPPSPGAPQDCGPGKSACRLHAVAPLAHPGRALGRFLWLGGEPPVRMEERGANAVAMAKKATTLIHGRDRNEYHDLRLQYAPQSTKLVIVAESPPASGKYFYDPTGATSEPLFAALMKQLRFSASRKEDGLREFQRRGWVLVDATYEPVNHL